MELTILALLVCGINLVSGWQAFKTVAPAINLIFNFQSFPSPLGDDLVSVDDKACRFWPKVTKLAIECCSVPELFDLDIKETCISECSNPDDPSFNTWCCTINCIFEETEIVSDGSFDGERAKEVLTEAFEDSKKMIKSLDGIVDTCEKQGKRFFLMTYFFSIKKRWLRFPFIKSIFVLRSYLWSRSW